MYTSVLISSTADVHARFEEMSCCTTCGSHGVCAKAMDMCKGHAPVPPFYTFLPRSLAQLLAAHKLVKVQLNGNPKKAQEFGELLATMAEADLLGVRGSHMLFASGMIQNITFVNAVTFFNCVLSLSMLPLPQPYEDFQHTFLGSSCGIFWRSTLFMFMQCLANQRS